MIDFATVLKQQPILRGRHVSVEPLLLDHVAALQEAVEDGRTYDLFFTGVSRPEGVVTYVEDTLRKAEEGVQRPYAVRELATGRIVGCTRFYDIDAAVPKLAIGYTFYAASVRRTAVNTETKLLLMTFAFETAGAEAVVFHTSFQNQRSRAAILRLGARQDGVLRADGRHKDGSLRDTVVFSILRSEWPAVRSHLELRLRVHDADDAGAPR